MQLSFIVKLEGNKYAIVINFGLFKTDLKIFKFITKHGCKIPEYKIEEATTVAFWLKHIMLKPVWKIKCLYWKYIKNIN